MTTEQVYRSVAKGIGLLSEIEHSSARISELVKAIKSTLYGSGSTTEVDVHDGLENTLIITSHKLKGGVEVTREYDGPAADQRLWKRAQCGPA